MVELRTDIDQVPLDGSRVIIGTMDGTILISRFCAPNEWHPAGRWVGLASYEWPVVWLEIPNHPYCPGASKALLSGGVAKA